MPHRIRARATSFFWMSGALAILILFRAYRVQVTDHDLWRERAESQILRVNDVPANRGAIFDRSGFPLALSGVRYEIGVAPNEIRPEEREDLITRMSDVLSLPESRVRRIVMDGDAWRVIPGRFTAEERNELSGFRGLHFTPLIRREYPQGLTALPLTGTVTADGRVLGGVEAVMDTLLTGIAGRKTVFRDVRGRTRGAAGMANLDPIPGGEVFLTLDSDLQQVGSEILRQQIEEVQAESGDLVVIDPRTGSVIVMVGRDGAGNETLSPAGAPYEPGSVIKPMAYAALLEAGAITFQDSVFAEFGSYTANGRTVTDVERHGWLTYLEALSVSSNVALVKTIERVPESLQFETLKAFGFGERSGIGISGESSGLLRDVSDWTPMSQASLAIGYEINVTPLQMALAYGALANGGVQMRARLVSHTRSPDGNLVEHPPIARGRVVSERVAEEMLDALGYVVREGSGRQADLGTFTVGGKTGTSRAWGQRGYQGHHASFIGLFPATDPQLIIVVRIVRPNTSVYYGGAVAAPVVRRLLEAMLSSADPPVDRAILAADNTYPMIAPLPPRPPREIRWRDLPRSAEIETSGIARW